MKRLAVFGDSYSCVPTENYPSLETTWHYRLAQYFDWDYLNLAKAGTSLDWSLDQYFTQLQSLSQDDCIIFVLTAPERLWFSDMDDPMDGNLGSDKANRWREKRKPITDYLLSYTPENIFNHARIKVALALKACASLHGLVILIDGGEDRRAQKLRELTLKSNSHFTYLDWSLGSISRSEFDNAEAWKENMRREVNRANHLNPSSHTLVGDRLINLIKDRQNGIYQEL